jgi:hypothetical protein
VYTEENVELALDAAAKAFCQSEVEMRTAVDEIVVSRIFQWYREDFGQTDIDVIRYVQGDPKRFVPIFYWIKKFIF